MKLARTILLASLLLCLAALAAAPVAGAAPAPAWTISAVPFPANLTPGGNGHLLVKATNVGGAPTSAPTTIEATLPAGLTPTSAILSPDNYFGTEPDPPNPPKFLGACTTGTETVSCETVVPVPASKTIWATIDLAVAPGSSAGEPVIATVSGGGAAQMTRAITPALQASPVHFGFLSALRAPFSQQDGAVALLAGSHPYQQTISFEFPTRVPPQTEELLASGPVRDIRVDLPAGLVADPSASPVLCTEAELEGAGCPDAATVGNLDVTLLGGQARTGLSTTSLYDMVPPPGYPAELATDVAANGLYLHLLPSVRSDGDYGISVSVPDILALPRQPVFGSISQIWGDPSSPLHDHDRGRCISAHGASCPVEAQPTAFWTLPARCDGVPLTTEVSADNWEEPGLFAHSSYQSADLADGPVSVSGCNQLTFAPSISARPTTNLADSPSGLDVDLHQPQDTDKEHRSPPPLRDATVTLPQGISVNPSQASGLLACTEAEIGLLAEGEEPGLHFSKQPNSCPEPSKLGTVEVTTPLLAQRDAEHRLQIDPQTGEPVPQVLHGAVYLAKPFQNPFGSLLALYLTVEDPATGTIAKLAGEVKPDPATGQLTTVFRENPQLPIEDIRLHLFGGARGALITPPVCGTHTTTTDLVPWSAPEIADARPSDSFHTTATPAPGACPTTPPGAPNAPAFDAGTLSPQAGAYSPFVLKLSREDGSQRLSGIDTTLAPGLTGKLAGIAECPEAAIAQATARSHPEEGITERENPSCPASSQVGIVNVGAGAGPTPIYTQGHAYLAGPYKGAPLSLAIITPAIAGPFDLGTVVVRTALYVDPFTAQIHAVSDPFPQILDGIPLDIRSVALQMDRPDFTLNPTSCDPLSITGGALSATGQTAPLTRPFQVGGCHSLKFKPRLSISLKGPTRRTGHPALKAVLTYSGGPGYANIGGAQVTLPGSEFLDQGNLSEVCTRPQLESHGCPPSSVYGKAEAWTPLLDAPLEGPVYLGTGYGYQLPALVAELGGQIRVLLKGKVDTGPGHGIRNTFEAVPDAPVSRFVIELKGGKKYGLLENSTNVCRSPQRATAVFTGQDGAVAELRPMIRNDCKGKPRHPRHNKHHAHKGGTGGRLAGGDRRRG
jgi:hypothetical protein